MLLLLLLLSLSSSVLHVPQYNAGAQNEARVPVTGVQKPLGNPPAAGELLRGLH